MRPIWKGAISFGLVNIPVGLYSVSNQVVDIKEFVDLDEIDPMFFDEPYFLAPLRPRRRMRARRIGFTKLG